MASAQPPAMLSAPVSFESGIPPFVRCQSTPTPPRRPGTPQLTMHDYRKFQHSPLLSQSPELEYKRVRRKPSVTDLAPSPSPAFASGPSSTSPLLLHDRLPTFLPLPSPTTPEARPATGSPSLSSTVTTLQSTPTHTPPELRGRSHFEQGWIPEGIGLSEPIRTKRKFPHFKQAKRLPRRADGGGSGSGSGGGGNGEIWEVYAAIIDPDAAVGDEAEQQMHVTERDEEKRLLPPFGGLTEVDPTQRRTVRFAPESGNYGSIPSSEKEERTATSTYSLSKFEFPVPPGHDNWTGASGPLEEQASSQSPATLHYHGASFDLVNPHASLLLSAPDFETPAEIDGLLDDYFDQRSEHNMSNYKLSAEPSHQSLGTGTDNSRHARVLYDDPAVARRNILGVQLDAHGLPTPPKAKLNESPRSYKSQLISPSLEDPNLHPDLPTQQDKPQSHNNTNPFRNLPSIGRILGWEGVGQDGVTSIEEGLAVPDATNAGNARPPLSVTSSKYSSSTLMNMTDCDVATRKIKSFSDPFDLTLSEGPNDDKTVTSAESKMKDGQRSEVVLPGEQKGEDDNIRSQISTGGADTQANTADQETDPTLKEILDGYSYTRAPSFDSVASSPAVEIGVGLDKDEHHTSKYMPFTTSACAQSGSSPYYDAGNPFLTDAEQDQTTRQAPDQVSSVLQTPSPVPSGAHMTEGFACTEIPTSEQTYGETNQLLQISPEVRYPPYRESSPCHSATCMIPGHEHMFGAVPEQRIQVNDRQVHLSLPLSSAHEYYTRDEFVMPRIILPDGSVNDEIQRARRYLRSSSLLSVTNESEWETQNTESRPDLRVPVYDRPSLESYANTSTYESYGRLSTGPDVFAHMTPIFESSPPGRMGTPLPALDHIPLADHDPESQWHRDLAKAISLLSDKVMGTNLASKDCGVSNTDKHQSDLDMKELERLRRDNPAVVREASHQLRQRVDEKIALSKSKSRSTLSNFKLPKPDSIPKLRKFMPARHRPEYDPGTSWAKAIKLGTRPGDNGSSSSQRGLLGSHPHEMSNGLQWSVSENTFVTVRETGTPQQKKNKNKTSGVWTPFEKDATVRALKSSGFQTPSADECPPASYFGGKGKSKGKNKQKGRSAVEGQHELHELRLMKTTKSRRPIGRCLTDAELAACAPGWHSRPNLNVGSALASYAMREEVRKDGPLDPRLVQAVENGDLDIACLDVKLADEQRRIGERVALYCVIFPLLPICFALGKFDWVIARKTNGRIKHMGRAEKWHAKTYILTLSVIIWACIILGIFMLVHHLKHTGENGAPF